MTALAVKNATARGYYGDGGGLYLQVSNSDAKSWVFRFKDDAKLREMGWGRCTRSVSPKPASAPRTGSGKYPVKAISATPGVARSNIIERRDG